MQSTIKNRIAESIAVKQDILNNATLLESIEKIVNVCVEAFSDDKKILFAGNGGSAADAQHLAAEFSGRFYKDRTPLFSEALHVNTSYITAVANDYSYDDIYSRLVEGTMYKGDVLIGFSTSGNSGNIVKAFEMAKSMGIVTIGFTGAAGGKMSE